MSHKTHLLRLFPFLCLSIRLSHAGYSETLIGIQGKDFILLASDGTVGGGGAVLTTQQLDKIRIFRNGIGIAGMGDPADVDFLMRTLQQKHSIDQPTSHHDRLLTVYDCATGQTRSNTRTNRRSDWTVECMAEALRYEIYEKLRTRNPMQETAFLIAGMLLNRGTTTTRRTPDILHVKDQIRVASKAFQQMPDSSSMDDTSTKDDASLSTTSSKQPALFWLDQYGSLQQVAYGAHGSASTLLWSVLDRGWHENMTLEQAQQLLDDCIQSLNQRFLFNNPKAAFVVKCIDENGCRQLS